MNRLFTTDHGVLLVCWILYCAVHSLLADGKWKKGVEQRMGPAYKYYRICYSLFATLSLAGLLWYHFTFPSDPPMINGKLIYYTGILLAVTGASIMVICIHKYFFNLSGIDVFFKKSSVSPTKLEQRGLHRFTRHPLYLGTLMFSWGLFLMMPYPQHLIANVVMTVYIVVAISWEEKKLLAEFGSAYREYAEKVPRLLPWRIKN
jgi:protein-S-isoprenylcysteine O-methyltransferase Ste14